MKNKPTAILLLGLIISCTQPTDSKSESNDTGTTSKQTIDESDKSITDQQMDTLTIVDSDLTIDPFDFGENPLKKLTSIDNAITDYQTYKNRHVDNQIDTSFQISIQEDTFEVYKTTSENWLTKATVNSVNFQIRQGLKVGMTKSEVREQLSIPLTENLPDLVRLQNLEVLEWVDLKFTNDRLESIRFKGYMD